MRPPDQSALTPFGKYLLDEEIARGGMARVYLGRLRGLGGFEKKLVVKQVLPDLARDPRFVEMFVEEAKTLVQMSHPHIVPVYELGVVDGIYFLAMEYIEGVTLAQMLRGGTLPAPLAAHLGMQICDALQYAHERHGLVHRDVTPRNVIVDGAGQARLLDFGIAAPAKGEDTGEVFGSHGYMSPEQARGEAVGPQSDLFSLGAVLYEALTRERAFLRASHEETRTALLDQDPPRLRGREDVPAGLADLIDELLERDPEGRPESAGRVAQRLRGWLAAAAPEGVAPELGARAEKTRARRRHSPSSRPPPPNRRDPSGYSRSIATSVTLQKIMERGSIPPPGPLQTTRIAERGERGGPTNLAHADTGSSTAPSGTVAMPKRAGRRRRKGMVWLAAAAALAALVGLKLWSDAAEADRANRTTPPRATIRATASPGDPTRPTQREPRDPPPPSPEQTTDRNHSGPVPAPSPPAAPEQAAPAARAFLTVQVQPWAELRVDGRSYGNGPHRRVAIPAGSHVVELRNPPLGAKAQTNLQISAGETAVIRANMNAHPPAIAVR